MSPRALRVGVNAEFRTRVRTDASRVERECNRFSAPDAERRRQATAFTAVMFSMKNEELKQTRETRVERWHAASGSAFRTFTRRVDIASSRWHGAEARWRRGDVVLREHVLASTSPDSLYERNDKCRRRCLHGRPPCRAAKASLRPKT